MKTELNHNIWLHRKMIEIKEIVKKKKKYNEKPNIKEVSCN